MRKPVIEYQETFYFFTDTNNEVCVHQQNETECPLSSPKYAYYVYLTKVNLICVDHINLCKRIENKKDALRYRDYLGGLS